ncbi:MAG: SGNH/GDSL hydrolase family protein [Methylococcaceae bacterium]
MKIKLIKFNSILFFLFLTLSLNAHADFDEIVIFGDSFSDTGNLASIRGPFPNSPFFEASRVSNSPVAVEGLAKKLDLSIDPSMHLVAGAGGSNFSVAGASASGDRPIDLSNQVAAYLLQTAGVASKNSLYVMFIGTNDLRVARDVSRKDSKTKLKAAVATIKQQLLVLISAGAQNIMVINAPNIGALPETRLLAAQTKNKRLVKQSKKLSKQFNKRLANQIKRIEKSTGVDLVLFDLFSYLQKILVNSKALGFTNTTDACFSIVNESFNPNCEFGQRFDEHLFFDENHITGRVHERVSRALYAEVPEAL